MATFQEIREEAGFSVSDLAKRAEVDYKTVKKADERSGSIHRLKALALVKVLNGVPTFLPPKIPAKDLSR